MRWLEASDVFWDGKPVLSELLFSAEVDVFTKIEAGGELIQPGKSRRYLMHHKASGTVCATRDAVHPTVLDGLAGELHSVGRLDLTTTGLLLLTNDGQWSHRITQEGNEIPKCYLVTTERPILSDYAETFAKGIYFHAERITTRPAEMEILGTHQARLILREGRHHQVKRMFLSVGNRVTQLHRERIGRIMLPEDLFCGEYREIAPSAVFD
jgi:16S rRNA pseudouridine516 synthase